MKRMFWLGLAVIALAATPTVQAQFETGFEAPTYFADSDGEDLNGQDSFFNPVPASSVSFKVHLYADNPLGISAPPTGGGEQFALGIGPGVNFFCRSQRPAPYGDGTGSWTVEFDEYATYTGSLPSAQNLGSFSTQDFVVPGGDRTCIMLSEWTDVNTTATWDASMVWFNAANAQVQEKGPTGFTGLAKDQWYHRWMTFDLDTNQVTEIGITDLNTNITSVANPTDRYLFGGSAGGPPPPDGFRLFAGTVTIPGNTLAFDNVKISAAGLCATNGCGEFSKMICKAGKGKVLMKGTGTAGLEIEATYDGTGECVAVNDRGKWKLVKKHQALGVHTGKACGTDRECELLP
ncbi:MAG: hypothetical protein IT449_05780 [Phycisphaerales bacterium]|nr:hypothetical protein [Phycisphaerales bacterium]